MGLAGAETVRMPAMLLMGGDVALGSAPDEVLPEQLTDRLIDPVVVKDPLEIRRSLDQFDGRLAVLTERIPVSCIFHDLIEDGRESSHLLWVEELTAEDESEGVVVVLLLVGEHLRLLMSTTFPH